MVRVRRKGVVWVVKWAVEMGARGGWMVVECGVNVKGVVGGEEGIGEEEGSAEAA